MPEYSGRSIVNLASSVFRSGGGPRRAWSELAPPLVPQLDLLESREPGPLVLFLVDGLGWARFEDWRKYRRRLAAPSWAEVAQPITTVFPSTTTCALTSLSTATPPSQHGIVGYRHFLPKYGVVADILKMSPVGTRTINALVGPGWSPSTVSGTPSVFRRGLPGVALSRDRFIGSGFTRLLYDGAEYVEYATASDLGHQLAAVLGRPRPPRVVYLYWDELDTVLHVRGVHPALANLEIDRLLSLLNFARQRLRPSLARRVTVAITGDHGQVPATVAADIRIDREPTIAPLLARSMAGDRRAGLFLARPGRERKLADALTDRLPSGSTLTSVREAIAEGLFGPPPFHAELEQRLGDLLALVPSPSGLRYVVPGDPEPSRFLFAAHGGLEPEELQVPLVISPLSEFVEAVADPRSETTSRRGRER